MPRQALENLENKPSIAPMLSRVSGLLHELDEVPPNREGFLLWLAQIVGIDHDLVLVGINCVELLFDESHLNELRAELTPSRVGNPSQPRKSVHITSDERWLIKE